MQKSLAGELISKGVESEEKMEKFDSFASELTKNLEATCKENVRLKLHGTKKEKCVSSSPLVML
jgi:hypothetical protein